jgi:cytochrome c-type biogenesis protein CcsB
MFGSLQFNLLGLALILALVGLWGFALAYFFKLPEAKVKLGSQILMLTILGLIAGSLTVRGLQLGRFPIANLYESLILMAAGLAGVYLLLSVRFNLNYLAWPTCIFVLGLLLYAIWLPSSQKEAIPLIPALQSYWRSIHVPPLLVSYGFFCLAAVTGILYLLEARNGRANSDKLNFYQDGIYRCVSFGFPLLTFGLVTGALWANHAWGNLWQWDPKENLALMTWFCYAAYLHLKISGRASGKTLAWIAIAGIFATYMTYLGINQFDLGGLHTYGKV